MTTYTYNVPSGHTAAYLEPRTTRGEVDVYLDSVSGSPAATFFDVSGHDVIDCGSVSNFTFIDDVIASKKPYGHTDSGVEVKGGSGSGGVRKLIVNAGANDKSIEITAVDSNSATITTTTDTVPSVTGIDQYGIGVNALTLVANDAGHATVLVPDFPYAQLAVETGSGAYDTISLGRTDGTVNDALVKTGGGHDVVEIAVSNDGDDPVSATVDFGAGGPGDLGLGLGNELFIGPFGSATLAQYPGSSGHTIVVESVEVQPGGLLVVGDATTAGEVHIIGGGEMDAEAPIQVAASMSSSTAGELTVDNNGTAEFTGGSNASYAYALHLEGTLNLDAETELDVDSLDSSGSHGTVNGADTSVLAVGEADITGTITFNLTAVSAVGVGTFDASSGVVNVNDGAELTVSNRSSFAVLNVDDDGSVLFQASQDVNSLTVTDGGLVTLEPRSSLSSAPKVLFIHSSVSASTGQIDITNNDMIVANGTVGTATSGVYDGISGLIQSGRNGGGWNGNGIVTSSASSSLYSIGIATAQQAKVLSGSNDTTTFAGETVTGHDVLIKFTYGGDATIDGKINVDDYGRIDFNVSLGVDGWFNGDFNYDGKIGVDDYGIIDFNVGIQGGTIQ